MSDRKVTPLAKAPLQSVKAVERSDKLGQQVYRELREALIAGAFPPGTPMSTRATAAAMGVSITPAREALARLVSEGVLVSMPGRTIEVPRPTRARLSEIYRIRKALEPMMVETALPNIKARAIEGLRRLCRAQAAALDAGDHRASLANNHRFHFTIYEAADMPVALRIVEGLWLQCGPVMRLLYPTYETDRIGVRNHLAMVDAIAARDGAALRAIRAKDLDTAEAVLLDALVEEGEVAPHAA